MKWDKTIGKQSQKGFTMIEVGLVLAITGLIFVGATAGISASLSRHRYSDTVNYVNQTLKDQFIAAGRVQIPTRESNAQRDLCALVDSGLSGEQRGRSDCSVYGTLIILGANEGRLIQALDLIGYDFGAYRDAIRSGGLVPTNSEADIENYLLGLNDIQLLGDLGVSATFDNPTNHSYELTTPITHHREIPWEGSIELPEGGPAKYAILAVRSPRDGSMHSYAYQYGESVEVRDYQPESFDPEQGILANSEQNVNELLRAGAFSSQDVYLCVENAEHSQHNSNTHPRRTIRINANGRGSTAVELINADDVSEEYDKCNV